MDKRPTRIPDEQVEELEQWIRNTSIPRSSMSKKIMHRIERDDMTRPRTGLTMAKRTMAAASIAFLLGAGAVGAGFVNPTMASALKQIPVIGSIFFSLNSDEIQRASDQGILMQPQESLTIDGVTLTLTNVLYDGTRLSYTIQRDGEQLPQEVVSPYIPMDSKIISGNSEWKNGRQVPDQQQKKGYIKSPITLINDTELKASNGFTFGDDIGNPKAVFAQYTNLDPLPNEFELTVRAAVTRVDKPFEFKVPVKISNSRLVLQPNETKSYESFTYTLQNIEASATSTRLVLESTGKVPASSEQMGGYAPTMMYYDIIDDQGKVLKQHRLSFYRKAPDLEYRVDELYDALSPDAKSVIIKPYTFTVNTSDLSIVGEELNNKGNIIKHGEKTYIKELEMNISIKP